jgi:hypothetical protein
MPNTQPFKRSLTKSYGLLKAVTKAFLSFCFIGPRSLCELSHRSSTLAFRNEQNGQSCWLYYCCGTPFWRRKWKFYWFCIAMPRISRASWILPCYCSCIVVHEEDAIVKSESPLPKWRQLVVFRTLVFLERVVRVRRFAFGFAFEREERHKIDLLQNLHSLGTCCLADFRWRYFFRKLLSEPCCSRPPVTWSIIRICRSTGNA